MSGLRSCLAIAFACLLACSSSASAKSRIEAVEGKRYVLHEAHGPWMIMVTTLRDVEQAFRADGGLSAWEAADQIVLELRRRGIPAYVFHQQEEREEVGRRTTRGHIIARQEYIAVLAGNFSSPEHKSARQVLKYIQDKFQPTFLGKEDSGAVTASGQDKSRPFQRAFPVPNPLRSEDEVRSATLDPIVKKLNSGISESLLKNKGSYTLQVATFSGNSVIQVAGKETKKQLNFFNKTFGSNLDESGHNAWELTTALRQAADLGYGHDYEAWVFHDRHKSIVTIGSFNSLDDPRIKQLRNEFAAKIKPHPKTGKDHLTPEMFTIPKNTRGSSPDRLWFFDAKPRVIRVPGK